VGEVVSPNSGGGTNARGSVVTMVDFASLEVQVDLPETSLKEARKGGPAQVFLDAFPERPYRGRVDRIWPTASRSKATVEVRVVFLDPDERLRPDMGVRVVFLPEGGAGEQVPGAETKRELIVPEPALARRDGVEGVFLLEGDVARFRPVTAGQPRNGRVAIASGVERGDPIVSPVPASLVDGDRVIPEEGK
jgi:multidrug efflux pump subunit AcrA (membrane-fusion protein)